MSAGWHVNEKGEAGKCEAKIKCPFGDETVHFTTEAAARKHFEKTQEESIALAAARKDRAEYGSKSKVFDSWSKIHGDFKSVVNGKRMVMVNGGGKGVILTPWHGPKVLERIRELDSKEFPDLSPEDKEKVDSMSTFDMLNKWRFAPIGTFQQGDPYSDYFEKVIKERQKKDPQGWVAASKALGH